MYKKIAGFICALISIFLVYVTTNYIDEPYRKYVELFHPNNAWDILIQYLELIPFLILSIYLRRSKSGADISRLVYILFIQISFVIAILFTEKASVKIDLVQFFRLNQWPKISARTAAILVLWLSNGIVMISVSFFLGKDKLISNKLRGFKWLLFLAAISWISIRAIAFYYIFYAFAIALLGGYFLLDNSDRKESQRANEQRKMEEKNKANIDNELNRIKEVTK